MNVSRPGTISLCMIVRDEEDRIGRCIESVRDVVDELVVVDTGSRDRTVEIAESYGARIVDYTWQADFGAARNAGIEVARSDWILVLDADELIAREDHGELSRMATASEQVAYRFVTRNYGNDRQLAGWVPSAPDDMYARGFTGWHPSVKVRMFPNGLGIRFSGRVHELVNDSLERLGVPRRMSDVHVHHYGRGPAGLPPDKRRLYLELGRKKVTDNPSDAKARFELGNLLAEMGRTDDAGAQYETALELAGRSPVVLAALGSVRYRQGRYPESARMYRDSIELDPDQPETRRNLATALIALGDYRAARDELDRLITRHSDMYDIRYLDGVAAQRLGEFDRAIEMYAAELARWPGHRRAAEAMAEMAGRPELYGRIMEVARTLIDNHPSVSHLMNLCGEVHHRGGNTEEAAELFGQAVAADPSYARAWNNLGVVRMAQNRLQDALDAFRHALRLDPHNPALQNNIRLLQTGV